MSDVVAEVQGPAQSRLEASRIPAALDERLDELEAEARANLSAQGFKPDQVMIQPQFLTRLSRPLPAAWWHPWWPTTNQPEACLDGQPSNTNLTAHVGGSRAGFAAEGKAAKPIHSQAAVGVHDTQRPLL